MAAKPYISVMGDGPPVPHNDTTGGETCHGLVLD
jgi:hypothetical protein